MTQEENKFATEIYDHSVMNITSMESSRILKSHKRENASHFYK